MKLQGSWRITEMDLWDRDDIDLADPAFIEFRGLVTDAERPRLAADPDDDYLAHAALDTRSVLVTRDEAAHF